MAVEPDLQQRRRSSIRWAGWWSLLWLLGLAAFTVVVAYLALLFSAFVGEALGPATGPTGPEARTIGVLLLASSASAAAGLGTAVAVAWLVATGVPRAWAPFTGAVAAALGGLAAAGVYYALQGVDLLLFLRP